MIPQFPNIFSFVFEFLYKLLTGYYFKPLVGFFTDYYPAFVFVSTALSVLMIVASVALAVRLSQVAKEERVKLYPEPQTEKTASERAWRRIVEHGDSDNPSDWKLAIIEADIVLEELLDSLGARGETIGDKLKGLDKSDLSSINDAWEAHKIRNMIAHEGAAFDLNKRDAQRVIAQYEKVFRELKYI